MELKPVDNLVTISRDPIADHFKGSCCFCKDQIKVHLFVNQSELKKLPCCNKEVHTILKNTTFENQKINKHLEFFEIYNDKAKV